MRSVVLKAWKEAIAHRVASDLPKFSPYSRRERGEDRGLLKFASELQPGLWGFLVFRPIDSDAFDAYVGWSTDGRCPYARVQVTSEPNDFTQPRAMFASITLAGRSGAAHWSFWSPDDSLTDDPAAFARAYLEYASREFSEDEARELIAPAVEAGIREIVLYGLPYLASRAASPS
jgi:hypothetical protein